MDREQLVQLRDALNVVLSWPPAVLDQIAAWLAPEAAKPNGHDLHPQANSLPREVRNLVTPSDAPTERAFVAEGVSPRRSPTPYAGKGAGHWRAHRRPCGRRAAPSAAAGGGELRPAAPEAELMRIRHGSGRWRNTIGARLTNSRCRRYG
jgi:hypothetical protein